MADSTRRPPRSRGDRPRATARCTPSSDGSAGELSLETVQPDASTAWVVLHGEADLGNRDALAATLSDLLLNGTRSVHLHLSDLTFADARAVAVLSGFASTARGRGLTVTTCDCTPLVRRVAGLLGVESDLGLV